MGERELNKEIRDKKQFAKENCSNKNKKVLSEVNRQIKVISELGKGYRLTETVILALLQLQSELQVENACRKLKVA